MGIMKQQKKRFRAISDNSSNHNDEDEAPTAYILSQRSVIDREESSLSQILDLIEWHSAFGRSLLGWAERNKIKIVMSDMEDNSYGYYFNNTVVLNKNHEAPLLVGTLVHELYHALQDVEYDCLHADALNFRSEFLYTLITEAAAEMASNIVIFDLAMEDVQEPYCNVMAQENGYSHLCSIYERELVDQLNRGASYKQAIYAAFERGFHAYFREKSLVHRYASTDLQNVLKDLLNEKYSDRELQPRTGMELSEEFTKLASLDMFGDGLLNNFYPPFSDEALFKEMDDVRDAFDYFDFKVMQQSLGDGNFAVERRRDILKERANPFINLDIEFLWQCYTDYTVDFEMRAKKDEDISPLTLIDIMHYVSGSQKGIQSNLPLEPRDEELNALSKLFEKSDIHVRPASQKSKPIKLKCL